MAMDKKLNAQIDQYYKTLADFAFQYALHEGAVSVAFQTLLADAARGHHWTLIPQLSRQEIGQIDSARWYAERSHGAGPRPLGS